MKKYFWLLLLACLAVYALLLAAPGLYFSKSMEYKGFTIRTRGALPSSVEKPLDLALEGIKASELFKEGMRFELVLPSTRGQFLFFTPFMHGEYFRVNPFNGAIFLAAADFEGGNAYIVPGGPRRRSLATVIIGAGAWELTRRKLRPLTYLFMNDWKIRGYSELLSGGTGEFEPADACAETDRPGLLDYKYGLMLDRVMKEDSIYYSDLLDRNFSSQNAETRIKRAYCGG
jgi:hypothetical protein